MHRAPDHLVALERARWLAELGEAIVQAQKLSWRLGVEEGCHEARQLYAALEAARTEVDSLRRGDWAEARTEIDPQWLKRLMHESAGLKPSTSGAG